jgi:uncharacterized protein
MQFEWDEAKRRANIIKHGVDFLDAPEMFTGLNPMLVMLDTRKDYQEDRFIGVGYSNGRIMVIIFTTPSPEIIRIISLRKALKHEQKKFEKALRHRLGQD